MSVILDLANAPSDFTGNPYPYYRQILQESPVLQQSDGSFLVAPWRMLNDIYRDTETYSSDKKAVFGPKYGQSPLFEHHTTSLVFNDPPLHTRVRKIIAGAMTPGAINKLEHGLETLVDRLLDELPSKTNKGNIDLVEHFASQIPINVIGNLFDIPWDERAPLRDWSLSILGALEPTLTAEQEQKGNQAVKDFSHYLDELAKERKSNPGDPSTDVLTRLLFSDKGSLSNSELLQNCIFILNAGHETTTNLIGNALGCLQENPEQRKQLQECTEVNNTAIDEFLRFESPNQLGNRLTTRDVKLGNQVVEKGTNLHLLIGAANRDADAFNNPDVLELKRKPNRHMAFAGGPHSCIGLNLARMEGRIAIGKFLRRFPDYQITAAYRSSRLRFRGYDKLESRL